MFTTAGESIGLTLSSVPAFLTKLWTLVDDASTDELICWDVSGKSFHVLDQARFAKEILPLYFKHNNIASFIRQLNMYGFRKIVNTDAVNIKLEKDDMEFAHPYFAKDQEHLLELIKRKVPSSKVAGVAGAGGDDVGTKADEFRHVLSEVNVVKGRQDTMTARLENLKLENDVLWREVANLRQMHMKQQQVVNKLIQFLLSLVGNKRTMVAGVKRKGPLMLGNTTLPPKVTRDKSPSKQSHTCYEVQSPQPSPVPNSSQPGASIVIDDVTDLIPTAALAAGATSLPGVMAGDTVLTATAVSPLAADPILSSEEFVINSTEETVKLEDALEPLAILESGYQPGLELKDVLDDETDTGVVGTSLPVDEVLSPTTSLIDDVVTPVSSTSSSLLPPNTTRTVAVADTCKSSRNEIESHLDMTASQLAGLRDILAGSPQLNIDSSLMMELFNFSMDTMPMCVEDFHCDDEEWRRTVESNLHNSQIKSETGGSIVGNELIQYTPPEDFSSLYDFNDVSYLVDDSEVVESSSFDAEVADVNVYLSTPRPPNVKVDDLMEDVD